MHLQMIVFPDAPAVDLRQSWYTDLTDEPPQEAVKRGHERYDKGPVPGRENADLTVSVDILKISFTVTPRMTAELLNQENPADRLPTLGPFSEACDWFVGLMARWLAGQHPPIKRLALNGKLVQYAASHESAYRKLSGYIPTVKLSPTSSDLIYRINRPRPSTSGVRGLRMNRLITWTVLKMLLQAQGITPTGEVMPTQTTAGEVFAVAAELDINTAWEFPGLLPSRKLPLLLRECAQLAAEVAGRGDVP